MGTIVILAGSVMLVVLVTLLIIESNRALSHLIKLPFNPLLVPAENAFKAGLLALAVGLMMGSQRPLASYGWGRLEASHVLLGMLAGTISVALVNWISSLAV